MLGAELLSNLYDKLGRLLTNAEQPTSWQVGETDTQLSKEKMWTVFCFSECCAAACTENMSHYINCYYFSRYYTYVNLYTHLSWATQKAVAFKWNYWAFQLFSCWFWVILTWIFHIQHTEALLYGFQSIAETIDVNYSDVIPGLIGLIPRININNIQLADTVMFTIGKTNTGYILEIINNVQENTPLSSKANGFLLSIWTFNLPLGALAEWLADHPVMLSSVLPLVLQALGNPDLSVSSVSTLKKICRECKYDLPPYATNIVAVSQVCEYTSASIFRWYWFIKYEANSEF